MKSSVSKINIEANPGEVTQPSASKAASEEKGTDCKGNAEVLVRVENVSKIFCRDLKKSLKYGFADSLRDVFSPGKKEQRTRNEDQTLRLGEFHAVKDVSFELRRGQCLGLIGHNGAGKTTLLKMLNGLIKPDTGCIEMHGRVGALIALGAGFNPILTGRENVFIAGSVLGFTQEEVKARYKEIVAFSELEDFMETPIQAYSSGMQVRLGFSVASALDPDILIIDEVLAVGDLGFRVKCMNKIHELLETTAVIFVSHSMPFVSRICSRGILLKKGRVQLQSDSVPKVIDHYHEEFDVGECKTVGSGEAEVLVSEVIGASGEGIPVIPFGESLELRIRLRIKSQCSLVGMRLVVWNQDQRAVLDVLNRDCTSFSWKNDRQDVTMTCRLPAMRLAPGKHAISLHVFDDERTRVLCRMDNAITFIMGHHLSTGAEVFEMAEWQIDALETL